MKKKEKKKEKKEQISMQCKWLCRVQSLSFVSHSRKTSHFYNSRARKLIFEIFWNFFSTVLHLKGRNGLNFLDTFGICLIYTQI